MAQARVVAAATIAEAWGMNAEVGESNVGEGEWMAGETELMAGPADLPKVVGMGMRRATPARTRRKEG
jgi:hypothetical protein